MFLLLAATRVETRGTNAQATQQRLENPTDRILAALDTFDIVAVDAAHGNKALDTYLRALIATPRLRRRIDDIVVECGNRKYQDVLDRYIAGDSLSDDVGEAAWKNT